MQGRIPTVYDFPTVSEVSLHLQWWSKSPHALVTTARSVCGMQCQLNTTSRSLTLAASPELGLVAIFSISLVTLEVHPEASISNDRGGGGGQHTHEARTACRSNGAEGSEGSGKVDSDTLHTVLASCLDANSHPCRAAIGYRERPAVQRIVAV